MRGKTNEGSEEFRYHNHLLALKGAQVITNIDPTLIELRAWIFLQIYRATIVK
ncbi:MAG: hypothetical protein LBP53_07100 [Candidatus Peribacteria bacterium]|nr:hypothetical protein [Candidatus Peribacteria bacterium]